MSLLTQKELTKVLKVNKVTLISYRKKGMPYIRLGPRLIRYDLNDVYEWLKENGGENYDKS